ncbi:hypothetical protein K469DRAFT_711529 [Zopfia rhizophila CBS 207.26]|uniref:Uncharacterized protein n=1 Tax=Zopfia rhizophila CBS 207.26 TaxID=1314779 RepID=A0A6A6DVL4_9PEZI|nr:hypothetical protein K469DRAFT_711529 [Zopfia rhizophila CBS 207.26]
MSRSMMNHVLIERGRKRRSLQRRRTPSRLARAERPARVLHFCEHWKDGIYCANIFQLAAQFWCSKVTAVVIADVISHCDDVPND